MGQWHQKEETRREKALRHSLYQTGQGTGFSRNSIQFFHSIDKDTGCHVTIGKAKYFGTFGMDTVLRNCDPEGVGDVVVIPNAGYGYEYTARATCHPEDTFDPKVGEELVTARIFAKFHADEREFLDNIAAQLQSYSDFVTQKRNARFGD